MEFDKIKEGIKGERRIIVDETTSAAKSIPGAEVFSTPALVELMELSCYHSVQDKLPEGYTTLGTFINLKHIKATPIGDEVKAICELVSVDGKKLEFSVEAFDSEGKIGEARHGRYIINGKKFFASVVRK